MKNGFFENRFFGVKNLGVRNQNKDPHIKKLPINRPWRPLVHPITICHQTYEEQPFAFLPAVRGAAVASPHPLSLTFLHSSKPKRQLRDGAAPGGREYSSKVVK